MGSVLEIDVNGEGVFVVDKGILSSFSDKLSKLFYKAKPTGNLKVVFHDLPGGAEAFELMARFCYLSGQFPITPCNVCLLHSVAHFMEMTEDVRSHNLIEQSEQYLQGIEYWTWSEVMLLLKQCQHLYPSVNSSGLLAKCLNCLAQKISAAYETSSPSASSSDSSSFRLSCDTKSPGSTKISSHKAYWYEEFLILNAEIIDMLVRLMMSHKVDHQLISRFLFYYFRSRVPTVESCEKYKIVDTVINLIFLLDPISVGCKNLFEVLRVASGVNTRKCCMDKLEKMIGSRLDQATLDNLLAPAPIGLGYLYDVDLVLRLLKTCISQASPTTLKKVANVMDMYVVEVAPDPCLRPPKFIALAKALPDSARDSSDRIVSAVDIYLQVHTELSVEEQMEVSCAVNYEKLSAEAFNHRAGRPKVQVISSQQSKSNSLRVETDSHKGPNNLQYGCKGHSGRREEDTITNNHVNLSAKEVDPLVPTDNLVAHLKGMQLRVMELEKICRKMQAQMLKIKTSKSSTNRRTLPRLCS